MDNKVVAISLGGSVVHTEAGINTDFLANFRDCIQTHITAGRQFVITVGGGTLSREIQSAAQTLANPSDDTLDSLGITAVSVHTSLLHAVFEGDVYSDICFADTIQSSYLTEAPIVIAGAQKTGKSTDHNALQAAASLDIDRVVIVSDVGYVYDEDPDTHPDAQPFDTLTLAEYIEMIPSEFSPGLHVPIGPPAARLAHEKGIEIALVGSQITCIGNAIAGDEFDGTLLVTDEEA